MEIYNSTVMGSWNHVHGVWLVPGLQSVLSQGREVLLLFSPSTLIASTLQTSYGKKSWPGAVETCVNCACSD